jgi:hypothetical protein
MSSKDNGWDIEELLGLGKILDSRPTGLRGDTVAMWMAESLLHIRDREGTERALRANAAQRQFERGRGQNNIILKARQMGMTTWIAGRFFLKTVTRHGVLTVQVAQTQEAAEGIFRMVQRFWERLPEELKDGPLRRSKANSGQMRFAELDSEFRVLSAGDEGAGRGLTVNNLHCSEVSRWPGDAAAVLAGLRGAVAPGGEVVLESTPNGAYGCFYEEWMEARERGTAQHFFPWWMEPAYVSDAVRDPRPEELLLMERNGLSSGQIGFRRELERRYRGLRSQDFAEDAESCFRATGACCFEIEAIEERLRGLTEPIQTRRGGALEIWLPPLPGKTYLVAADTAGGGADGDFAAVQVIERETGVQCAELRERIGPLELARAAAMLAREYGGAMIAVERNNHGAGVLAYLDSSERYGRVYEQGGGAGWLTTAGNKPGMISRIGALLVEAPWVFQSRRLLGECRTYVSYPGGRLGGAHGAHDDCLMAMAVAQGVRAELA